MQAWQDFLAALEIDLGAATVEKWLRPFKVIHFDAKNLYLEAPDSFQTAWFEEHIRQRAKKHFINNNHSPIKIHVSSLQEKRSSPKDSPLPSPEIQDEHSVKMTFANDELDTCACFDNFHVGEKNKMAFSLFKSLLTQVKEPSQYNPIYVYGGGGTGKSHLLMAIAKELQRAGKRALYVKTETFTQNVVHAIRTGHMNDFRKKYRDIDILIVDDVHMLAKKTATQEEFFHTFNALHTSGKQIILSASAPAFMLCDIEPRLTSRFEWGITLPLGVLENKEIELIVQTRLKKIGIAVEKSTLEHLLLSFSYQLTSLHKAVDALALRTEPAKEDLTLSQLNTLLSDLLNEKKHYEMTPQKIVQAVAEYYGIKTEDILGRSQSQEYTVARQVAMYLCREKTKNSFKKIGQYFQRDHSTVISSVNLIKEKLLKKELHLPTDVKSIEEKLK